MFNEPTMKLEIVTPEQVFFSGEVNSVTLPGSLGFFSIWEHHASLISMLKTGKILYQLDGKVHELEIDGGFAEVDKNIITVCVENILSK
jgi:F-type H+-transporting ATPase subunit epsilon